MPSKYFLEHSLLHPLKQWELNGYTEWFTFSEFLTKYKVLTHKALPDLMSKKVLFQLSPEERIVMVAVAFLKDLTSVYFGTTHLLMRKDARMQLEVQVKEGPCLVRNMPADQTLLINYIKSKSTELHRNRDICIQYENDNGEDSEDEEQIYMQLLSKCSSRSKILSRN